jgi:cation:H+ antiporter
VRPAKCGVGASDAMAADLVLLALSFLVIIVGAELFTNGVEWLGVRLKLSEGAVGSVLAAVGTALPETLIPVVALVFFREKESHEIGLGAILGAPFMLATLAFFVTALAAWAYRQRRETGWRLRLNRTVMSRDLAFFLPLYGAAIGVSFTPAGHAARRLVALGLVAAYGCYLYLNLRETKEGEKEEALMFNVIWAWLPLLRPARGHAVYQARLAQLDGQRPRLRAVSGQVLVALGLIMGGAYEFVRATQEICLMIGFSPLLFSLIVAPVATELPEKFNSVIWIRQGKDTLSLGNITGAMVFQATVPVTLGILLTEWLFGGMSHGDAALVSAAIALVSAAVVLGTVRCGRAKTMAPWALAMGIVGWVAFVGYVAATVT